MIIIIIYIVSIIHTAIVCTDKVGGITITFRPYVGGILKTMVGSAFIVLYTVW